MEVLNSAPKTTVLSNGSKKQWVKRSLYNCSNRREKGSQQLWQSSCTWMRIWELSRHANQLKILNYLKSLLPNHNRLNREKYQRQGLLGVWNLWTMKDLSTGSVKLNFNPIRFPKLLPSLLHHQLTVRRSNKCQLVKNNRIVFKLWLKRIKINLGSPVVRSCLKMRGNWDEKANQEKILSQRKS